ncbi:Wadjet anti-phage system protein JetD domain-containing protein [Arthrobacter sp. NPDC093128]|uniref:Wadjet anti-phage system protein JetD domain-containing protein n=1 Tax=Arthrobacter sp. NPDC093128 TaxID=3154979 RepID=UPI003420F85E
MDLSQIADDTTNAVSSTSPVPKDGARRRSWPRAVLSRLTADETTLYEALGNGTFGKSIRLEQELIRWDWARERLGG